MLKELVRMNANASVKLPTKYGQANMELFLDPTDNKEHLAIVFGEVKDKDNVLARVHSECLTGDIFGSLRCDCGPQLDSALKFISEQGTGVLLYLRQEGRGIGLLEKLKAYNLQDKGYDTVEANVMLGHKPDERTYEMAAKIFHSLGVKSIQLITNNPSKVNSLKQLGIDVSERVALPLSVTKENTNYLKIKAEKMKHIFNRVL